METNSLGFIGGGRITRIILRALKNKNVTLSNVSVFDINQEATNSLSEKFPEIRIAGIESAAKSEVVVIAVHPPVIMECLEKIAAMVTEETVILSLAPKITIEKMAGRLPGITRFVRLIPNATSVINQGYNPICFSEAVTGGIKTSIMKLLQVLGHTFEVPEKKLEAYAMISAMAPTYFWFQWEKLAGLGIEFGLKETESNEAVFHTMSAALSTLFRSGLTAGEVIDLIPVKPIGEHEEEIKAIYDQKLKGLYGKISS